MTNILFSIQLKVNSNILDLEIMEDDTLKTVIDRLCRRGDQEGKSQLANKIIHSLEKIKSLETTTASLKLKICKFLNKALSESHDNRKPNFKANQKQTQKTPFKQIENFSNKKSINKQRVFQLQQRCQTIQQQSLFPSTSVINNPEINPYSTDQQDLILAYKVVLAKSKDNQIKNLIHKTLSDLQIKELKKQKTMANLQRPLKRTQQRQSTSINGIRSKYLYNPVRRSVYLMHSQYKQIQPKIQSVSRKTTQIHIENNKQKENKYLSKQIKDQQTIKFTQLIPFIPRSKSSQNCIKKYNYLQQEDG